MEDEAQDMVGTPRIAASDSQLFTILDGLPVTVMLRSADGLLLHLNPAGERFLERLGVDESAIRPSPSSLLDHVEVVREDRSPQDPDDLPVVVACRETTSREATLGYAVPGGGHVWYATRAVPVTLADGTTGTVVTCDDVTERHEARRRVEVAERSLRRTFERAPIGIAVVSPTGEVLEVNAALCDLLGRDGTELLGRGLGTAVRHDSAPEESADEDGADGDWLDLRSRLAGDQERYLVERNFVHAAGRTIFTQMSIAVVRSDDGDPLHVIVQVVDLTARREFDQELRDAASKDPLTGLANRRALTHALSAAQRRHAVDPEAGIGLVYLDLVRFKEINDAHGHDTGDRLLVAAAEQLRGATREDDTVCRIGGDEFVVLCAPVDGPHGLEGLVDRIRSVLPVRLPAADEEVAVTATLGAVLVEPGEDIDAALRRADTRMYRAKRSGHPALVDPGDRG